VKSYRQAGYLSGSRSAWRQQSLSAPAIGDCYYPVVVLPTGGNGVSKGHQTRAGGFNARVYLGDALSQQRRFSEAADAYRKPSISNRGFRRPVLAGISLMDPCNLPKQYPISNGRTNSSPRTTGGVRPFFAYLITSQYKKRRKFILSALALAAPAPRLVYAGRRPAVQEEFSSVRDRRARPRIRSGVDTHLPRRTIRVHVRCRYVWADLRLGSVVVGMLAAPVPLLIAALTAFPISRGELPSRRRGVCVEIRWHRLSGPGAGDLGNSGYVS